MTADIRLLRWPARDREDYERLAAALRRVREVAARGRGEIVVPVPAGPEEPSDADRARALLEQRRQRDRRAGPLAELFGEPGWDILLTLFIAYEEARHMPVAELAPAIGVRPAVMTRWQSVLQIRGLIRAVDAEHVSLTDEGLALVLGCIGVA